MSNYTYTKLEQSPSSSTSPNESTQETPNNKRCFGAAFLVAALVVLCVPFAFTKTYMMHQIDGKEVKRSEIQLRFPGIIHSDMLDEVSQVRVAWLMSFPNSGTSYTLKLVRTASNVSTATNHCETRDYYRPVFSEPGPHYLIEGKKHPRTSPKSNVLTKTHCGGKCNQCQPSKYMITQQDFERECLTECYGYPKTSKRTYNSKLVGRAVHLFRSPFDNVVSRFHLHMHNMENSENSEEIKTLYSPKGFQDFCRFEDSLFSKEETEAFGNEFTELAKGVPCHADFYRYVQWHNLAIQTTVRMGIPVHIMHYEDYHEKHEETIKTLLDFLDMPDERERVDYHWSDYSAYFTDDERDATGKFLRRYASPEIWSELRRYFL